MTPIFYSNATILGKCTNSWVKAKEIGPKKSERVKKLEIKIKNPSAHCFKTLFLFL